MINELLMHVGFDDHIHRIHELGIDAEAECLSLETASRQRLSTMESTSTLTFLARTVADLRRAVSFDDVLPEASRVVVWLTYLAARYSPPLPSMCDEDVWRRDSHLDIFHKRANPWQHLTEIRGTRMAPHGWRLTMDFDCGVPSGLVIAAVLRSFDGHRASPVGNLAGPTGPGAQLTALYGTTGWSESPSPHEPATAPQAVSRASLLENPLAAAIGHGDSTMNPVTGSTSNRSALMSLRVAPIDERCINPIGFRRSSTTHTGTLMRQNTGFGVDRSEGEPVFFPPSGAISEFEIDLLRDLRHVSLPAALTANVSETLVRIVLNLAAAGVPVVAESSPRLLEAFDSDLAALLSSTDAEGLAEPLLREVHSIRLRRHALMRYGTMARWRDLAGANRLPLWDRPKVSVVLCTRRIEMVPFALRQVLHQRGIDLEVILALHGVPAAKLREANPGLDLPAHVQVVEIPATVPLGEALNHAASRSGGSYIAKMDDDDWYGPDHLADLVLSHLYTGAELIGTDTEFVYLQELDKTVRLWSDNTESPTHLTDRGLVTGGSTFITRSMLEALGGYRLVPLFEDSELCSAVRSAGGTVYRQHGLNYLYRRRPPAEHTWQVPTTWFLREEVPEWPGLFMNDLMLP
jgi:hypothetical protein